MGQSEDRASTLGLIANRIVGPQAPGAEGTCERKETPGDDITGDYLRLPYGQYGLSEALC